MAHESTDMVLANLISPSAGTENESPINTDPCHNERQRDWMSSIWAVNSRILIEISPHSRVRQYPLLLRPSQMSVDSPLRANSGLPFCYICQNWTRIRGTISINGDSRIIKYKLMLLKLYHMKSILATIDPWLWSLLDLYHFVTWFVKSRNLE